MGRRFVYFVAGITCTYLCVSPLFSGMPNTRPAWVEVVFWASALCLLIAAIHRPGKIATVFALSGSGVVFAVVFLWLMGVAPFQSHVQLVAVHETWFDQWRLLLDRPLFILFAISTLLSLGISLRQLVAPARVH
jgi:hypothetical protein